MTSVRAAVLVACREPLSIESLDLGSPRPGEVLVRTSASGVCHTDLTVATTPARAVPVILGHEGAGVVEAVGEQVAGLRPGDRVITTYSPGCGVCWYCQRDMGRHCDRTMELWNVSRARRSDGTLVPSLTGLGTFAEAMRVDARSVVRVDSDLPDAVLAMIGCGVTTGLGAALNTAPIEPGDSVAVIGCGGVGLSALQGARIAGAARIIAVDPVPLKREQALVLGATDTVDPSSVDPVEAVRELIAGRGVDVAIDAIGYASTVAQASAMTRKAGTAVIVGMAGRAETLRIPLATYAHDERRIIGSFYGSSEARRDFQRCIDLAERGLLELGSMVSREIGLADVDDAFRAMEDGEVLRSVITFN